ncbi:MAG: hypothetical protein FJZ58_04100, partial [Chlamydiae bacterium]|nr:hypothetical protein [Chlamydiota bacterium]
MDQKLGEAVVVLQTFPQLQQALDGLATPTFLRATPRQKEEQIHRLLLTLIQKEQVPCFLLGAVNAFILAIREKNWLESYVFSHFEFWLNRASGLSQEENYFIRAKIAGKYLPREAYQVLFPIGMGKFYSGSHYVTAHGSPDLDTTVASFWGWLDAFSARVSEGLHLWNIPGGAPESQVEVQFLFPGMLGKDCFTHFAKNRTALSLSAMDLVTQEDVVRKTGNELVFGGEGGKKGAMLLVDDEGYYLGDWRPLDEEEVRKVAILLHNCLRFFASVFHKKLTYLFSQDVLLSQELQEAIQGLFALTFAEIELVKEYAESQRVLLSNYLTKVLSIQGGLQSSFHDFWQAMDRIPLPHFAFFKEQVESFASSSLFDSAEKLVETRSVIFDALERSVTALENAIQSFKRHGEQLQVAFTIKKQLLVTERESISYRAELEEIRSRMDDLPYLTVTMPDAHRGEEAVGIVKASVLTKPFLGTVSLRDFCNRDETKIPSYFEVISVIDHHKSALATGAAPVAFIGDAQSANALVAEVAFSLYDSYAAPCSLKSIAEQYAELQESKTPGRLRLLQRLLQKQAIIESQQPYFVDSKREYMEYLQYLYAILDDTDLLSKVSYRDVICVVSLLNRMKSLLSGKEQEVLQLDDLPRDNMFAVNAAKRILQNEEMYSLYRKIYLAKEEALVQSLRLCVKGEKTSLFADTKVQNGCNRVGQTKLFENTFPAYLERAGEIRAIWYFEAKHYQEEHKDCDLHMHMMSTVPSAESVYAGGEKAYEHKDELWLWI